MSHHQDGEQPFTVTRRTVLKGAAVTGAAVALSGGGAAVASKTVIRGLADTGKPIAAVAGDEKVISTYCPPNCGGHAFLTAPCATAASLRWSRASTRTPATPRSAFGV